MIFGQIGQMNANGDLENFFSKKNLMSYLAAILVLLIHISTFANYSNISSDSLWMGPLTWMQATICRCAVPVFFFFAGICFFRNYDNGKYFGKLKKRVSSLLIPYLLWNTLGLLFGVLVTLFFAKYMLGRQPPDLSLRGIFLSIFFFRHNIVFWFIFDLMVFVLASPVIYILLKNKYAGGITLLLAGTAIAFGYHFSRENPWSTIFYLFGAYMGIHYFDWLIKPSRIKTITGLVGALICPMILTFLKIYYGTGVFYSIALIFYVMSLFFAFDCFNYPKTMPKILTHSFWVFAMHQNVSACITKVLSLLFPKTVFFAWTNLLLTVFLTLCVIELIATGIEKYSPWLYKLLSGNR